MQMAGCKSKRGFKFLLTFLIVLTISGNILLSDSTIKTYYYFFSNYVELYVKPFESSQISEISFEGNQACRMPILPYNDPAALKYYSADLRKLEEMFAACPFNADKSGQLESFVQLISYSDETGREFHIFHLQMKEIRQSFHLSADPECTLQIFDKKMNWTESSNKLEYGALLSFHQAQGYNISVEEFGYYYIRCIKTESFINTLVFDKIQTVLPLNMTRIMERRRALYARSEKSLIAAHRNSSMIRDTDIKYCQTMKSEETATSFDNSTVNLCVSPHGSFAPHKHNEKPDEYSNVPKMNLLIIGIDSISTSHFKRAFPVTFSFLKEKTETNVMLENLNCVGANTYPNILAMLTGLDEPNGEMDFFHKIDGHFHDHLPFVWKQLEELGYVTMYQEDSPAISIFNWYKDGFRYWPTGLYNRAFNQKYYEMRSGPYKCHFDKPSFLTWFEQIELFVDRMSLPVNKKTPFFSLSFLTEYTHDYFAVPPDFDKQLEAMLRRLEASGTLDNTMLVVMSDHGNRLLKYSFATEIGKLERYRPFFSIKLPKRLAHTRLMQNLRENRKKLISFYDVYKTLRHFVFMNKFSQYANDSNNKLQQFRESTSKDRSLRGVSLFESIPGNRSCEDAMIGNKFCSCFESTSISEREFMAQTGSSFQIAISTVLDYVNNMTESHRDQCERFHFNKTVSLKNVKLNKISVFVMLFVLEPGEAWFEANLVVDKQINRVKVQSTPVRMSRYGDQSSCIDEPLLKNFCFCK